MRLTAFIIQQMTSPTWKETQVTVWDDGVNLFFNRLALKQIKNALTANTKKESKAILKSVGLNEIVPKG